MNPALLELAVRATKCPAWEWVEGMLPISLVEGPPDEWIALRGRYSKGDYVDPDDLPMLWEPATLGCLQVLVMRAWSGASKWQFNIQAESGCSLILLKDGRLRTFYGNSGLETLVSALEGAP
jgi:hypothetical protein